MKIRELLIWLEAVWLAEAIVFFVAVNVAIFGASVALCWGLATAFRRRRIFDRWQPLRPLDLVAAIHAIFLNTAVSIDSIPMLRSLGTSTFHAGHHEHPGHNFGFYTLVWDRLFGTLDPDYEDRFDQRRQSTTGER